MARPSRFTDSEIEAAAAALVADGKDVTGYTLSTKLGGGRPSSLAEKWLEINAVKTAPEKLPDLPVETQAVLTEIATEIKQKLKDELTQMQADSAKEAAKRIAEIEKKAQEEVAAARAELDDAVENLGVQKERAEAAEAALKAAEEQLVEHKTELAKAQGTLEAFERTNTELIEKLKLELNAPKAAGHHKA